MTCAKKRVGCSIVATQADGTRRTYYGTNACANPQPVCPREPGQGYEKCKSICQQEGHAEEVALKLAAQDAVGATAILHNHTYFCRSCQEQLFAAGVKYLSREK